MRFTIVQGHPDPSEGRLNRALATRYAEAALAAGHEVRYVDVARMDFPLLRSARDFNDGAPPAGIQEAQRDIAWADHLAFFFPLWAADMPALLKAFLEQTFRPGFALDYSGRGFPKKLLTGKSARVVTTMGMPAFFYRARFGAHALKAFALNLGMCGIAPVRETLIGGAGNVCARSSRRLFDRMARLAVRDGERSRERAVTVPAALAAAGLAAAGAYAAYVAFTWARFGGQRSPSLLDASLPHYDVRLRHDVRVNAPAAETFATLRHTEFMHSAFAQALFRARELLMGARHDERIVEGGFFEQLEALGWRILAEDPGREIAFGTITQPWQPNPVFRGFSPSEFARFDAPGYAKIALTLSVEPVGADSCVARTETRVQTTDPHSRARFRRYWAFLSPGIEMIRIVLLQQLKHEAESKHKACLK
jgi:putative NADPH-quinone reductase